jgi:ribosomal protein S18 acetylase RimI-like enzyme
MVYSITELKKAIHDVKRFNCGTPALNLWLQSTAGQHQKNGISKTYVLTADEAPALIVGYFTLALRKMTPKEAIPDSMAKKLPTHVPGYTLARLGVAQEFQRQGFGETLLMDAMQKVRAAAMLVSGYAMFVDAKDEPAADFYRKFGFTAFPSDPLILVIPIADIPE